MFILLFKTIKIAYFKEIYIQGGQGNLSANLVKRITVKVPCKEKQRKIANLLIKIDQIIENQSHKFVLLQKRKQGFLQKMFI
ncbi:restriction endonuclease subunit S [Staphylococcus pasteuri]|nr:restriction endonuclease subunit S [Staphylococcus pasteuri]